MFEANEQTGNHKDPHNVALYVAGGIGIVVLLVVAAKGSGGGGGATVIQPNAQAIAAGDQAAAAEQASQQGAAVAMAQNATAQKVQLATLTDSLDYAIRNIKSQNYQAKIASKTILSQDEIAARGQTAIAKLTSATHSTPTASNDASILAQLQAEIAAIVAMLSQTRPVTPPTTYAPPQTYGYPIAPQPGGGYGPSYYQPMGA